MTNRQKKRLLDLSGLLVSILLPAAAAISEFPRVKAATTGGNAFFDFLNVSAAAMAVIAVVTIFTAWRFLKHRIKMPTSGFLPSLLAYLIVRGMHLIIAPLESILFWVVAGCAVAWVLYFIADKKYGEGT